MYSVSSKLFPLASKMNANLSVSYLLSIILHAIDSNTCSLFFSVIRIASYRSIDSKGKKNSSRKVNANEDQISLVQSISPCVRHVM